jgi:hypothetical protein
MNVNRRMLWPKRKRVTGRCKRRLGPYRMKVRARYKRWLRWSRSTTLRVRWCLVEGISSWPEEVIAGLVEDMCQEEDARFLAMLDRIVASGRRLYYRKK